MSGCSRPTTPVVGSAHVQTLISRTRVRLAQEYGATLVFVAMLMPVLLISAALAVDLGILRSARQQAQSAADAGALAGASDNVSGAVDVPTATADANALVQSNDQAATDSVTAPFGNDPDAVQVVVSKPIPLLFAQVFGLSNARVSATAVASSDLGSPLAYFGGDDSDLQDGSATSDGWDNFCAGTKLAPDPPYQPDNESNSLAGSDDPPRCPAGAAPDNESLDGWDVIHGGIDISRSNFFSPPDPSNPSDQMVDLTGTCVEKNGNFPSPQSGTTSISLNGSTTNNDGFCENNADGEIEESLPTKVGQTYTVKFWLGSNTWGYPYEKPLMAMASTEEASNLPPMADTNGDPTNDGTGSPYQSKTSPTYGTLYPLENSPSWPSYNGVILAHEEFFYYGPAGGATDPNWVQESFSFTAQGTPTYLSFGSLVNCSPDWILTSKLNNGYFYPSSGSASITGDLPGSVSGAASTTDWVQPPQQVNDDVQNPYQNQCKYGAGISDVTISGSGTVALTQ
jgi:Putative Flp pilus-assembly TadE/G-like